MALRYVLDENLRGPFWRGVRQECARATPPVEVTRVGDPPDLPLGTTDPDVLAWAERAGRVLVTLDGKTMPTFHSAHLATGRHSAGVLVIRPGQSRRAVLAFLIDWAQQFDPADMRDVVMHIP